MTINADASKILPVTNPRITISGQLYDDRNHRAKNTKVHIYDSSNKYIAFARTSHKTGAFAFDLPLHMRINDTVLLCFKACIENDKASNHPKIEHDRTLAKKVSHIKARFENQETTHKITIGSSSVDIGKVRLDKPYLSQQVPLSYTLDIVVSAIPAAFTGLMEKFKETLDFFNIHDISDIIQAFEVESVPMTSENIWRLLTDGICPQYPKRKHGLILFEVNWDRYNFDKLESLPNAKIYFDDSSGGLPRLVRGELQFRKTLDASSANEDKGPVLVAIPGQSDFDNLMKKILSSFFVYGETAFHLGISHVYAAKVSQLIHDYFVGTVLEELLFPHCRYIEKITFDLGKVQIFGENSVLDASALDVDGIALMISDVEAALNPFTFVPRKPMNDEHKYAQFQQLHHDVVQETVHEFFEMNWPSILKDWPKISRFFRKLHRLSPPYRPWDGEDPKSAKWIDPSEIGGSGIEGPPRTKFHESDSSVRAMPRVARNPKGPQGKDPMWVENFFTHFIKIVTGDHSWWHPSQYKINPHVPHVRDPNFTPITTNGLGDEPYGGISINEAIKQQVILQVFMNFPFEKYSLLNSNVCEGLKDRIKARSDEYRACGKNPEDLAATVPI